MIKLTTLKNVSRICFSNFKFTPKESKFDPPKSLKISSYLAKKKRKEKKKKISIQVLLGQEYPLMAK